MDHFGIGLAIKGATRVYEHSARGAGRTTSLIESLKDGDRVVFMNQHHAKHFQTLCNQRNLKVNCIVLEPREPHRLFDKPPSEGRTLFDHCWVTAFYDLAIERAGKEIDNMQRESSGFGTAHHETRLQAEALRKWGFL